MSASYYIIYNLMIICMYVRMMPWSENVPTNLTQFIWTHPRRNAICDAVLEGPLAHHVTLDVFTLNILSSAGTATGALVHWLFDLLVPYKLQAKGSNSGFNFTGEMALSCPQLCHPIAHAIATLLRANSQSARLVRPEGLLLRIAFQNVAGGLGFWATLLFIAIQKPMFVGATRMFTHGVGTRNEKFGVSD